MKVDVKVPKMGESIVEATIGAILKPSGSYVKEGEEILEIETEKVNQVLTASASGQIALTVKPGDVVKIGQVIGSIEPSAARAEPKAPAARVEPKAPAPAARVEPKTPPPAARVEPKTPPPAARAEPKAPAPKASARKTVDESVAEITAPPAFPKASPASPPRVSGRETRKKMSKLRRVIAERLVQVKNETAMLTTFNEVDMHAVMKMRTDNQEAFQKKHGVKLGFMSFFVKAVVSALQQFPDLNARIDKDEIVYHHFYDIGIAVSTDKGLFVPVVRNADTLSFAEIELCIKQYADKAKSGSITVDDMQGGTFTITNGGTFGSMLSTPILNPPQSGILGMHNIVKRPVVIKEEIAIRPIMYLALSYDHRIVDGKESISFLMHIKNVLEDPTRFLLDL
ncbi:MAG: 2-oxoglutarate dehydrogenase complex dihydrolipoyllysine-residue succinyltransferase [Verrucomicrobia bacterium]|nr:2-oxoglutarate dehydrogenase complex dihydrolipoyllysine-residue succinyltransferase [Verrucomicrobiota bacterium]MBU6446528.1 2-oxoglutarate dehydrogenase complex dihydrolipoyllysine-residue succinyltransferase [Verrucomicrobiota bacterium]